MSLHEVHKPFSMAANPSRVSSGTTCSPPEDEEEELALERSISVDGEGGGDGKGKVGEPYTVGHH